MRLATFALASLCVVASAHATWVPFTTAQGKFSIEFPSKPQVQSNQSPIQGKTYTTYIFMAPDPEGMAMVTATEMPAGTTVNSKSMIDGYLNAFVKSAHATQVSRKAFSVHGYSGEEVDFTTGKGKGAVWSFTTHGSLYGVVALATKGTGLDALRSHLFNSFHAR